MANGGELRTNNAVRRSPALSPGRFAKVGLRDSLSIELGRASRPFVSECAHPISEPAAFTSETFLSTSQTSSPTLRYSLSCG